MKMERLNQMTKSIEEQAEEYATGDGATIEKRKCFTVDLHLGNPQQYEYVKIYNNDAYCGFIAGSKARDAQWSAVVNELKMKLKTCENDYWFMVNLLEKYSSDKDQAIKDCIERMKFRKPIFNLTKADQMLKEMGIG